MAVNKSAYKVDLATQLAECDANYARLLKLLPKLGSESEWTIGVGSERPHRQVKIQVVEATKYTHTLEICELSEVSSDLAAPTMTVRVYHDVCMAEVIAFNRHWRARQRYEYPNGRMLQVDEKRQQNLYLGEWLTNCLQHGYAQEYAVLVDDG